MKLVIIGCGLIGQKRAQAVDLSDQIVACCDINKDVANRFAETYNCQAFYNYQQLLETIECDVIVIAVVNKYIKEIATASLDSGRHIIAEKPLGRNFLEASFIHDNLNRLSANKYIAFKTGFNHRFHPGIMEAKKIVDSGIIGEIGIMRARYGHGGRPGMEKEWRASKELCGGGELLDQGVHVIDLIRWFGGEIISVFGDVSTKFWDMEVEDNAFAILKTSRGVTAALHVSWTNWKNIFSFEIFGKDGYIKVEGLGGSYGPEILEVGIRKKEGGKPDIQVREFPPVDISWKEEWKEFKAAIAERRQPLGNCFDGMMANKVVEAIYQSSEQNRLLTINLL